MIISSHQLGELAELCNCYVYIEGGRLKEKIAHQGDGVLLVHLTKENKIFFRLLKFFIKKYFRGNKCVGKR